MVVQVKWDNENSQKIILFKFEGDWTWFEFREGLQYAEDLALDVTHLIHYIYDFSESRLPQKAFVANLQKLFSVKINPMPEKILVVEKGHVLEMLKDLLARATQQSLDNVEFAESLARARAIAEMS